MDNLSLDSVIENIMIIKYLQHVILIDFIRSINIDNDITMLITENE